MAIEYLSSPRIFTMVPSAHAPGVGEAVAGHRLARPLARPVAHSLQAEWRLAVAAGPSRAEPNRPHTAGYASSCHVPGQARSAPMAGLRRLRRRDSVAPMQGGT